jgi:hypothetical protein
MNKTLKWILIGLAIAVGVFIIAVPIFYLARHAGNLAEFGRDVMPFRSGTHMMPRTWPFMMFPLAGLFGFFRLLVPLAVVGFAVYGIVALARGRNGRAPQFPPAVPPAKTEGRVCASCGKPLPDEGEFCPHCGAKQ